MAIEIINVGASPNDGNGDPIRDAFIKCNDNFDELETTKISGSGTDDYIPKFNGPDAIQNSQIFDNGTNVGIGTNTPSSTLQVGNGIGIKNIFISGAGSSLALGGLSVSFLGFSSGTISTINTSGSVPLGVGTRSTQPLVLGTNNAERMRIDSSGNVGIGTTSPEVKLDIYGTGTIQHRLQSSSGGDIRFSVDSVGRLGTYSASDFLLLSSGSERMRITSSGNVGIGTTSPSGKLDVFSTSDVYQNIITSGSGTSSVLSMYNSSGNTDGAAIGYNGAIRFGTITGVNAGGFSEKMRIDSSGNVGIGTTSPGALLDVNGSIYSRSGIILSNNFGGYSGSDVNFTTNTSGGANLIFKTSLTERMRIDSGGNVGIGTTAPQAKLHINNGTNRNLWFRDNGSGTGIELLSINDAQSSRQSLAFSASSFYFDNGNVGIGTASPSSSAILHLRSTSKGFLPPVMRTGDRNSISSPAIGLVIFNEDSQTIEVYTTLGWKSLLY